MTTDNSIWRRATEKDCGKGGWRCACCGPNPKHRQKVRRQARRRIKIEDRNLQFED